MDTWYQKPPDEKPKRQLKSQAIIGPRILVKKPKTIADPVKNSMVISVVNRDTHDTKCYRKA